MTDLTARIADELANVLGKVVEGWTIDRIEEGARDQAKRVGFSDRGGEYLEAWVVSDDQDHTVILNCSPGRPISIDEVRLMRKIAVVFNADLQAVRNVVVAQDLWGALRETRLLRAAARLSTFSTEPLFRWMSAFEAASRQTYEGAPFSGSVILATYLPTFQAHAKGRFHRFPRPLGFGQALLKEKWLKPFLQNGEFALVSISRRGRVSGFADTSAAWPDQEVRGPTEALDGLYGYLRPATSILTASPTGDIRFVLPTGVTFVKSQGEWRYQTWQILGEILEERLGSQIGGHALRLIASASYMRRGSLYIFLDDGVNPSEVVADHVRADRAAGLLRSTLAGRSIRQPAQRKIVEAASRIDGAMLFNGKGHIVDVASMVGEPGPEVLDSLGLARPERLSGARSTAAWNASCHGLAIKVSDDGPVDAYEYGKLVFHSG